MFLNNIGHEDDCLQNIESPLGDESYLSVVRSNNHTVL